VEDEVQALQAWLQRFPPRWAVQPWPAVGVLSETAREALFQEMIAALERLKDVFGYEAVYFGIGCTVFPEAPQQRQEPE
jgi:hypothetical protein